MHQIDHNKDWQEILSSDSSYNNDRTDWSEIYDWIIARLPGGIVLDVVCGLGHFLAMVPNKYKIGIDISNVAIEIAEKRSPDTLFWIMDINGDRFKTVLRALQYDIICFLQVLEHLENDLAIIEKIPSGKTVFISLPIESNAHPGHVRNF